MNARKGKGNALVCLGKYDLALETLIQTFIINIKILIRYE